MLHLLLPLFLVFCSDAAVITHLPGFDGPLPFHLETGYVGVDDVNGVEMFYYFIESEGNPREDPVLLWLSGGPGCSSFTGLVFQIGPLNFRRERYNGSLPSLIYNPVSWTKASSIIFLDSPIGAGFSFAKHFEGYKVGDIKSSKLVYKFILKWFFEHPQFLSNHLYIAGDSYAGKVVPFIAEEISEGIEGGYKPSLNLKSATKNCEGQDHRSPTTTECDNTLDIIQKFISEIQEHHILEPKCVRALARSKRRLAKEDYNELLVLPSFVREAYNELKVPPPVPDIWCRSYLHFLSYYWANNKVIREALHIEKESVREWQRCNRDLPYVNDIPSSIKYHQSLTIKGYRALVYSGDHDAVLPFLGTQAWIRSLNFSVVDDWRSWRVGDQVAGYTVTYANNLTFATVKGGGHTAPEYRPKECLAMIRRWISYQPL